MELKASLIFTMSLRNIWIIHVSLISCICAELYQPRAYVKQKTPTSVDLAWTYDDDTFVEHYTIKYTLANTNDTKVVLLPGPWLENNNFNITGLVSGGVYNFHLIAESGTQAQAVDLRIHTGM